MPVAGDVHARGALAQVGVGHAQGGQYRSGIYWGTEAERKVVESSLASLQKSGIFKEVHTEVKQASTFYVAENYPQDDYKKNPVRYNYYRLSCGRDAQLKRV